MCDPCMIGFSYCPGGVWQFFQRRHKKSRFAEIRSLAANPSKRVRVPRSGKYQVVVRGSGFAEQIFLMLIRQTCDAYSSLFDFLWVKNIGISRPKLHPLFSAFSTQEPLLSGILLSINARREQ